MKRQKILVLMHESLVPPDSLDGYSEEEVLTWKTEFDVVTSLRQMGHEVLPLGVYDDLGDIRRSINKFQPDITFNLLEEFQGVGVYGHHVVAYLELMRQPYTGCNPRGLLLSSDKPLAKKILAYHRIRTPKFFVVSRNTRNFERRNSFPFPLLVKSVSEDASLGISDSSIVYDDESLADRIAFVHEKVKTDALVETFIEGREIYVGVIGNRRLTTLPIWEMVFNNAPKGMPQIATAKVKWDLEYQKKLGIETKEATDLEPEIVAKILSTCKRVYRALSLSGYARMDLRLDENGDVFVLEANPNPNLSYGEDLAESAEKVGIGYQDLLSKIISLGLSYQAAWRLA